jgi:hypothetical protein
MREACKGKWERDSWAIPYILDRCDAYKPASTAKVMAQKPNCKLLHKNSVFSVPIIVTTNIIYKRICDILTGLLLSIGHQFTENYFFSPHVLMTLRSNSESDWSFFLGCITDLVLCGVGYHHAGMDVNDRKLIERMFSQGDLAVLS